MQPTKMRFFLPSLNAAMNIAQDEEEFEKLEFEWERRITDYWEYEIPYLPKMCVHFYKKIDSLHNKEYEVSVEGNNCVILFKDYCVVKFKCNNVFYEQTLPDCFCLNYKKIYYDEFHYDNNKLSWHFTSSDGKEYGFFDISDFTFEKI